MDEFPPKVEARNFQGRYFANAWAAHSGDEEHEFVGIHRCIDDSRSGVGIEEKNLRMRFSCQREHDVRLFNIRDRVTPLSAYLHFGR